MKYCFLTLFVMFLGCSLFAQSSADVKALQSGEMNQKDFAVKMTMDIKTQYGLDKAQEVKLYKIAVRKAKNYAEIGTLADKELSKKKMMTQRKQTIQNMNSVMNKKQYHAYVQDNKNFLKKVARQRSKRAK